MAPVPLRLRMSAPPGRAGGAPAPYAAGGADPPSQNAGEDTPTGPSCLPPHATNVPKIRKPSSEFLITESVRWPTTLRPDGLEEPERGAHPRKGRSGCASPSRERKEEVLRPLVDRAAIAAAVTWPTEVIPCERLTCPKQDGLHRTSRRSKKSSKRGEAAGGLQALACVPRGAGKPGLWGEVTRKLRQVRATHPASLFERS